MLDFDFEPDSPTWAKRLAAFDLETTGLDLKESRIVTACIAVLDSNGEPTQVKEWLVNPGIEIPASASAVHGVTTEHAISNGIPAAQAVAEIVLTLDELMKQMPIVAFNAAYDFTILDSEARRYSVEPLDPTRVIDPLVIDRAMIQKRFGKRNLGVLCHDYGVQLSNAHNSTADAIAAGQLAQRQAARFGGLNISSEELHQRQISWAKTQAEDFANWMKTQNRPDFRAELGWPVRAS